MFHSKQYLENYPDLQDVFGSDYRAALLHYITIGQAEGRDGYTIGGGHGRWTVKSDNGPGGHPVYISCSERTAGAVDSLTWKDKEFLNSYDHGRQLQMAMTVQNHGECWNPTEAGGRSDGIDFETKSNLTDIVVSKNQMRTISLPAYWVRGDDVTAIPSGTQCPKGHESYNEEDTHPYEMMKFIDFGCFGLDSCIQYSLRAELGDSPYMPCCQGFAQMEAPTAYLNSDFDQVSYLDPNNKTLTKQTLESGETEKLVIIHTQDQEYALGVISESRNSTSAGVPGLHYAYFSFNIQNFDSKTFKWSVVVREDLQLGLVFDVHSYLCVGMLDEVVDCLLSIHQQINP